MTNKNHFERHELSSLFGDMTELEFSELKTDIEQNGFAQPIIYVYEGKILDGWHRYRVAVNLDKVSELEFTPLDGIQNPLGFAMGVNYFRRHMTASHRAVVKALAHQSEWMQLGDNQHIEGLQNYRPKSSSQMAKEVHVSTRIMDAARKVVRLGLADEVIKHKKSVFQVLKEQDHVRLCYIEPHTLEHYEINRSICFADIQTLLHELYCRSGNYSEYAFYIERPNGKCESTQCENCFEMGNYHGAGCAAIGTHLDEVDSIIKELAKDPAETAKLLAENPDALDQLKKILVDTSKIMMDAECFIIKNLGHLTDDQIARILVEVQNGNRIDESLLRGEA